jgi:hypothetical protein
MSKREQHQSNLVPDKRGDEFAELRKKWGVYLPEELKRECARSDGRFVIEDLIPERSLALMVGDSGLGKSPLAYQMAVCVAAGIPFLGLPTQKAGVLYLDFENGLQDVNGLISRLSKYLGLSAPPNELALWNINYSSPNWGQYGHTALEMIRDLKPGMVLMDPISAPYPDVEMKNDAATRLYQDLRTVIRDCGCSIVNLHHRKKPQSPRPGDTVVVHSLDDDGHPRGWFLQARGSSVLVNGADIRLGVDIPGMRGAAQSEIVLVMRGYGRVRGEIPTLYLARVKDDQDEALGYRRVAGIRLLRNKDQEAAFGKLPDRFTTKEATQTYGRQDEATNEFLKKCIAIGVLRKVARGAYEKIQLAE